MNEGSRAARVVKGLFITGIVGTVLVALIAGLVYLHFSDGLPKILSVEDYRPFAVTQIGRAHV